MADDQVEDPDTQRERYAELLSELRTIIPGVQVLLAFLLTVPFASRFDLLDGVGRDLYLVTLMAAASAVVVFLVPSAYHRLTPHTARARRLAVGTRSLIGGLALLALAIASATLLVVRFVFSTGVGLLAAGAVVLAMLVLWIVLPVLHGAGRDR